MILALLLQLGCGSAEAVTQPTLTPHPAPRGTNAAHFNLETANTTVAAQLRVVQALSDDERAQMHAAMAVATVNCPLTRASMQLPAALLHTVESIPVEHIDPTVRADWAQLQTGLVGHVELVDAMGGTLRLPEPGDALFLGPGPAVMVDTATLNAASDPMGLTDGLVREIPALVETLDELERERITRHVDAVYEHVGRGVQLAEVLYGWQLGLMDIYPYVTDAESQALVDEMILSLVFYSEQGC